MALKLTGRLPDEKRYQAGFLIIMRSVKTATPAMARAINDRLALDLLLSRGPLTAPQLRELTGLSRPTVSDLIERLKVGGLIEEAGEAGDDRRGPNARLYGLVAGRAHVAGVDVRRNAVHATVADLTGHPVGTAVRALPDPGVGAPRRSVGSAAPGSDAGGGAPVRSAGSAVRALPGAGGGAPGRSVGPGSVGGAAGRAVGSKPGGFDLADIIADAVAAAAGGRALHTVVLGAPGLVHPHTGGLVSDSEVPGWRADLLESVRLRLGAHAVLENEVNLAAIAEHRVGAAVGHDDFVLLWLDDGVGAAVVLDGKLRRGVSGGAGEVGLLDIEGQDFCCTVESQVARTLNPSALAGRITKGALALVAVLDPGLVVLGGSTGRDGGEELASLVNERIRALTPAPTQVRATTVEGNAILQGAVLTALDLARDAVYG